MTTGSVIYFLFIVAWFFWPPLAVIPWWVAFAPWLIGAAALGIWGLLVVASFIWRGR